MRFLVTCLAVLIGIPALAQDFPPPAPTGEIPRCAPRSQIVYRLANQFEEFARWQGVNDKGGLVEWFGNEESGTWTLIVTTPDMQACIVSVWQAFSASMPVNPSDPA
jgi:hypothetical protein